MALSSNPRGGLYPAHDDRLDPIVGGAGGDFLPERLLPDLPIRRGRWQTRLRFYRWWRQSPYRASFCHDRPCRMSDDPPIHRFQLEGRLAGAVVHGKLVYLAGQVAEDPTLDAEAQTADVLRQIDALLTQAGTDKSRLLSCQIYLSDIRDIAAMNCAWDRWLDAANPPARATVEAKLVDPRWKVEITGIAALP